MGGCGYGGGAGEMVLEVEGVMKFRGLSEHVGVFVWRKGRRRGRRWWWWWFKRQGRSFTESHLESRLYKTGNGLSKIRWLYITFGLWVAQCRRCKNLATIGTVTRILAEQNQFGRLSVSMEKTTFRLILSQCGVFPVKGNNEVPRVITPISCNVFDSS
jgi:hypothetical protein